MSILVGIQANGEKNYESARGLPSDEDIQKANELNRLIEDGMKKLQKKLIKEKKKNDKKNKTPSYWELGKVLRHIYFDTGLVDPAEKSLYWINARMHTPEMLLAKDRSPFRIHLEYCFRLAAFAKDKALALHWSEWCELFDRSGINQEERFEKWFDDKMQNQTIDATRESIRLFAKCTNSILGKKETSMLDNTELFNCYETAWLLSRKLLQNTNKYNTKELSNRLKEAMRNNYNLIGNVIDGSLLPVKFTDIVAKETLKQN